jgi:diadenosine tetraphosphatase ApaH/serine/threonine PP2A family protein phosphatase
MRYLILSDIHSNDEALAGVLHRVKRKKFDRIICLGDFVGYAADPNKVLDRFRALPKTRFSIRGNHDKVVTGSDPGELFNPPAMLAALWTAEKISKENLEFLRKLPLGPTIVDDTFVVCHGSPLDEDAYIFSDFDASMNFIQMDRMAAGIPLCFFGHSHIPSVFTLEPDGGIRVEAIRGSRHRLLLHPDRKYLVNPGSVGQPRDRNPHAAYALFDAAERVVHFDRVPYDVQTTRRKIHRAGLPPVLGDRLVIGL